MCNAITRFLFLLLLLPCLYAYELPPIPGQRYNIGSHSLHLHCQGQGHPAIIIDSGLGHDSTHWKAVFDQTSLVSQTCVYDRSGYGWSDAGPRPRTSRRIAYELSQLLNRAHISPPYILVGHSFAGFNVRLFAAQHPHSVVGMVLIESSHEQQYTQLNIKLPPAHKHPNQIIVMTRHARPIPLSKAVLMDRSYRTARDEIAALSQSVKQVKKEGAIPVIPLTVISRGQAEWFGSRYNKEREKRWRMLQSDLTSLSPLSQHIFAHRSGHDIPKKQPEIIIRALTEMVKLIRNPISS